MTESMNFSRRQFVLSSAMVSVAALVNPRNLFSQSAAVQPLFARLDEYIARHMRETGVPGLTLALANRDGLIRVSTYGFADLKAKARVVPETMFEIGSVSKSFVGLVLLQLRDEGKLDLNKPVVEYLPWLKINSKFEPITTHHLLSHTAGLPGAPLLLDARTYAHTAWYECECADHHHRTTRTDGRRLRAAQRRTSVSDRWSTRGSAVDRS